MLVLLELELEVWRVEAWVLRVEVLEVLVLA